MLESFELQFPGFYCFLKVYAHPNFLSFGVLLVFYAVKFVLLAFCFESKYYTKEHHEYSLCLLFNFKTGLIVCVIKWATFSWFKFQV